MENENNNKLGAGIITISVIYLIIYAVFIISSALCLVSFDQLTNQLSSLGMDPSLISKNSLIITLICSALLAIGIIFILCKKAIGVYLYFIVFLINFISGIIMNGFNITSLIGLILPCLYAYFIYKKKYIFGFGKDNNQSESM